MDKALGICRRIVVGVAFIGQQCRIFPNGLPIGTPVDAEGPARQLLTGVPLALSNMHKTANGVMVLQLLHDVGGKAALGWALRFGVPFGCITI